ncbi:DUF1049 domain-containing protein [Salibacterium salarium]|uniref:DUF1049 domain-containing protein n=1 Tax=Salibacterium salarium TaxID=284579 RepID=A0A428N7S9_9BACI|nr:lipopolysaccharide assembly protein LapA domain-containing protein [Salibacterium salarium]RSL34408.1 DUF1049 domain-containing protein [Salibacterium salarium]
MKGQSGLIFGFIAALIIAVFAVMNVESVEVNYIFGTAKWPLILVILGSVLMGAVVVGSFGMIKVYRLQQQIKQLKKSTDKKTNTEANKESSNQRTQTKNNETNSRNKDSK